MIIVENIVINGRALKHIYSDAGFKIIRDDGVVFDDVVTVNSASEYAENSEPINEQITDAEALSIITGGAT